MSGHADRSGVLGALLFGLLERRGQGPAHEHGQFAHRRHGGLCEHHGRFHLVCLQIDHRAGPSSQADGFDLVGDQAFRQQEDGCAAALRGGTRVGCFQLKNPTVALLFERYRVKGRHRVLGPPGAGGVQEQQHPRASGLLYRREMSFPGVSSRCGKPPRFGRTPTLIHETVLLSRFYYMFSSHSGLPWPEDPNATYCQIRS